VALAELKKVEDAAPGLSNCTGSSDPELFKTAAGPDAAKVLEV